MNQLEGRLAELQIEPFWVLPGIHAESVTQHSPGSRQRTLGWTMPQQLSTPQGLHSWGGPLCNPCGVEIWFDDPFPRVALR